jgi:S1-C subfamily serine protease
LSVDYGALIDSDGKNPAIVSGSPAERAGLKKGDIILEINGQKITENNILGAVISRLFPGDTIDLKILRDGREFNLKVILGKYPEN